jgi:hypothetical protein
LGSLIPLLAEAAPEEYLNAVEVALREEKCPFDELFMQEGDGVTGTSLMSGVLWALETIAWDPDLLGRVVLCLGALAERDPGGRWTNRPSNSLRDILLPWMPQTCAPILVRKTAVEVLLREYPNQGWKLLLALLPALHSISSGTRRPAWRDSIPEDWPSRASRDDIHIQVGIYSQLAVEEAKKSVERLLQIIPCLDNFPKEASDLLLAYLMSESIGTISEGDRGKLWNAMTDLVAQHKRFADASWAVSPETVDMWTAVASHLAPRDLATLHGRLFSGRHSDLYDENGDFAKQEQILDERRRKAVFEIDKRGGLSAVLSFVKTIKEPGQLGVAFAQIASPDVDKAIIPKLLHADDEHIRIFASSYTWGRFRELGWEWVDLLYSSDWSQEEVGQFLASLPFVSGVWDRTKIWLSVDDGVYWRKASVNPYQTDKNMEYAVERLCANDRPLAAIHCLEGMLQKKEPIDNILAVKALRGAIATKEAGHGLDQHAILAIIKYLQDSSMIESDELLNIEWAYLPLLDRHLKASPKALERRLAIDPAAFCEVIRLVFKSKKTPISEKMLNSQEQAIAENGYRLLNDWRQVPGLLVNQTLDGRFLAEWVSCVTKECEKTGHLDVAMIIVGQVFIWSPPDPDGLWIHRAVAGILDAATAGQMRSGFTIAIMNSRGVHHFSSGSEERGLAVKYREKAVATETAGFVRLAAALREVAADYTRQADREASRNTFDDS